MLPPSLTPTTNVAYYSVHRGPVFGSDGEFHHFMRQCDPIHTRNGYWRFSTYDDDRRAYKCGLSTPEAVLIAQDIRDGVYDDIILRWVPGELDVCNKPSVGTAAAHLETIYNERRILGKPLSFRGRVPLYPISTDQRLINYRLTRYGIQKGVSPDKTLTSPNHTAPTTSTPVTNARSSPNRVPATVSTTASSLSSPQAKSRLVSPIRSAPTSVAVPRNITPIRSNPLVPIMHYTTTGVHLGSTEDLQASQLTQHDHRKASPISPRLHGRMPPNSTSTSGITHGSFPSPAAKPGGVKKHNLSDDNENACYMHGSNGIVDDSIGDISVLLCTNLTPSELFEIQSATLPCMDCGLVVIHASHCWINEAALILKPTEELTAFRLRELVENVERFDPGPWTTHVGLPQQLVEDDSKTQVQGMTKIIRNLDATTKDPELQVFDDQFTVLLRALKSPGNVQIIKGAHSVSGIGLDDYEMPDAW
ncbi:hypothetical protein BU25DRAFT_484597 [Macroventuria anomochaeta]|uniref:Uncharacterized protein n=1 Tax=Macroventuria anomochaeta TaxID=301207 RepID=A0ACB6SAX2_9PLEO|nr:uncharacterized protein BU25DRAFT_484597 [Macroventuria anomochaeta]KAF2630464.1 hypothetical protein BU25DRAFT_484597 [Macroventuria anomochaeta]